MDAAATNLKSHDDFFCIAVFAARSRRIGIDGFCIVSTFREGNQYTSPECDFQPLSPGRSTSRKIAAEIVPRDPDSAVISPQRAPSPSPSLDQQPHSYTHEASPEQRQTNTGEERASAHKRASQKAADQFLIGTVRRKNE